MKGDANTNSWVLGYPFLRGHFTVLDVDKTLIGIMPLSKDCIRNGTKCLDKYRDLV
jgi:hypothetical protein